MHEQDATLEIDGVRIPGKLALPEGAARAAVLILPGSLFSDADGDFPAWNVFPHASRDIAHHLAARGIASLRQAKIGPGTGSVTVDAEKAKAHGRFLNRVRVASAGLTHLCEHVPSVPAFVAGHSEGAVVASLLGAEGDAPIDGVISLSGPALRLIDIMRAQTAAMFPGADMAIYDRAMADIRAGQPIRDEDKANPMLAGMVHMPPEALQFIAQIDAVDPLVEIAKVKQRMLLIQGGRDQSVFPEQVDQLAAARAGLPTEVARFPELNHTYKRVPEGLSSMESLSVSTESDPAVADAIAGWIG